MPQADDPPLTHRWSNSDRFVPRLVVRPMQRFLDASTSGALLMFAATVVALMWANSPFADSYDDLWHTPVRLAIGSWDTLPDLTLGDWVNDGAMTLFFFVVALEIKRELVSGELREPRAAALPVIAALGGMVVPAVIYLVLNIGTPGQHGWGIPMATDIAFSVAIVAALGDRIPRGARLLLLSLAIVDDLGAIVVIAVFYATGLGYGWLLIAIMLVVAALVLQRVGVRALTPYVVLCIACWSALYQSGVQPTLAGVAFGLVTPVWSLHDPERFPRWARQIADTVEQMYEDEVMSGAEYDSLASSMRDARRLAIDTSSPLERVEHGLAPWATFAVVPVFALANAGVRLPIDALTSWTTDRVSLGIVLGLLLGKTIGVWGSIFLATRTSLGVLPRGISMRQVGAIAVCAGTGFTVALFITDLAFVSPQLQDSAKLGIFVGSALAAITGYILLRVCVARPADPGEDTVDGTPQPSRY